MCYHCVHHLHHLTWSGRIAWCSFRRLYTHQIMGRAVERTTFAIVTISLGTPSHVVPKKENIQKQSTAPLRVNSLPVTLLLVVAAVWQIFDSNGTLYMKEESHSCCTCKSSETCSRPTPDCSCFAWKGFSPLLKELWSVGFLWEMRVNSQWISSDVSHNISCWCRGHIPRHTLMPFVYLCICYTRLLDALSDGFQDWWLAGLDVRCLRIALVVRTILSLQRQRCKLPCEFFS